MYDIAVERDWRWVDCWAPPSWIGHNWGVDEPNNGGEGALPENCGLIMGSNGYFADRECGQRYKYICEIERECK